MKTETGGLPDVASRIRLATRSDSQAIARVLERSFAPFETQYTAEAYSATTPEAGVIRARFDEGPIWVAEAEMRLVGTASALPRGDRLYVRSMAVVPEARGGGYARQLLAAVEEYAHEHAVRALVLCTTPFLHDAIRLYDRAGFRRTGEGPHDLFGTPLFTMEKELLS